MANFLCNLNGFPSIKKEEVWNFLKEQGFEYIPDYITPTDESAMITELDTNTWRQDLDRRVQIFGQKYNFVKCYMDLKEPLRPFPQFEQHSSSGAIPSSAIIERTLDEKLTPMRFDEISCNEYQVGQGISAHTDKFFWGETIIGLSLLSPVIMDFTNKKLGFSFSLFLQPRSLMIMRNNARYEWTHGIMRRKTDTFEGVTYTRQRRVSLTYRYLTGDPYTRCSYCHDMGHNLRTCPEKHIDQMMEKIDLKGEKEEKQCEEIATQNQETLLAAH